VSEPLIEEHARLLRQTEALRLEHRRLEQDPKDLEAHEKHRQKLTQQLTELRVHIQRIKTETVVR
jgi:hypothetical protein